MQLVTLPTKRRISQIGTYKPSIFHGIEVASTNAHTSTFFHKRKNLIRFKPFLPGGIKGS